MKQITVIGGGAAGLNFLRKCRELGFEGKLILIDKNSYWYDRARFYQDFNFKDRLDYAVFCKEIKAELITDTVDKVNFNRKKIYFKNRESLDFEYLFAAPGLKSKELAVKGQHREGFYYLSGLDLLQLRDRLKFSDDACVYLSTILGLKLIFYLRSIKKDVSIVAQNLDFLGDKRDAFMD